MAARDIQTGIRKLHVLHEHDEEKTSIPVSIRLIFLRIGELETKAEKFHAHVAIEARWFLSADDPTVGEETTVKLPEDYAETHWHPQLFLLNAAHDRHEEVKYSLNKVGQRLQVKEFRDVHGSFHSKFDLHHFPTDIQELSVSIGSALFDREVTLEADLHRASGINREAFVDQQEWKLYDHVETRTRFIKGFLFQNDDDNELDTPGHEHKRSILTIACHAARRSNYFFWNGYCLIFLITIVAFSSFAIPANGTQFRLAIACTLLLTSIAFRWTMSNSLPTISYLTLIDMYAIVSIFVLIVLGTWHSIIGTLVFLDEQYKDLSPQSRWVRLDRYAFICLVSLYVLVHLGMGVWHVCVPIAQRRRMEELDRRYRSIVEENLSKKSRSQLNEEEKS